MSTYTVYLHQCPDRTAYAGVTSRKPEYRWNNGNGYKDQTPFYDQIQFFGWNEIEHIILGQTTDKNEALMLEDMVITMLRAEGRCLNTNQRGCETCTKEGRRLTPTKLKIYQRVHNFNRRHPDKAIETPMEAKTKYLETGYVPSYIKNDDLKIN